MGHLSSSLAEATSKKGWQEIESLIKRDRYLNGPPWPADHTLKSTDLTPWNAKSGHDASDSAHSDHNF
jgi:hypothetical protein